MGYYVRSLNSKKSSPAWKVQFISHRKENCEESLAVKPKKEWDIPKDRWRALGFSKKLTLLEARARASQLNALDRLKRQEERIQELLHQNKKYADENESNFPQLFKSEFEKCYILTRMEDRKERTQRIRHWEAAQKAIISVGLNQAIGSMNQSSSTHTSEKKLLAFPTFKK